MVFESMVMHELREDLLKISRSDCSVLITGETGTGKEVVAEFIHRNSARAKGTFVPVNCSAIPEALLEAELFGHERGAFTGAALAREGKLEFAHRGTVFLDEICDMALPAQPKILRAIEKREVYRLGGNRVTRIDVRFISATNKEPETMVREGSFREDLFYRLNVARVCIPPLRERLEDLRPLINHFISQFNLQYKNAVEEVTEEALAVLLSYDWPGNIRELRNVIEAAYINLPYKRIDVQHLPKHFLKCVSNRKETLRTERHELLTALSCTQWNKSKAAEELNWSRTKVYRKMKQYQIFPGRQNDQELRRPS